MLKNKHSIFSRLPSRATAIFLATQAIVFAQTNAAYGQDGDNSPQVMQTPDGQLYIMTVDEEGNPTLKPLNKLGGKTKKQAVETAPAAPPKPTEKQVPPAPVVAPAGNVQNFNFNEGSNVKIVPTETGVEVEVTPPPPETESPPPASSPPAAEKVAEEPPAEDTSEPGLAVLPILTPEETGNTETLWSNGGFGFSIKAKEYKLNSEVALAQGVHKYAPALGLHLEYNIPRSSLYIGTGFNIMRFEDEDPFFVETYRGWGRFSMEESQTSGGSGYLELGQRFGMFNDRVYLGMKVGYEDMAYAERYIDLCRNCYEEDLELKAGTYFGGGLGIRLFEFQDGEGLYLDVNYVEYAGDSSFESASSVQLTWVF